MPEPSISVVIPVYNGARFLADALASVAAQTLATLETVVVDDGSTDGSHEVAARFPWARVLRQANRGVAHARNAGVAATTGALVAFLDADDTWRPGKLERQVAALAAAPDRGYALCCEEFVLEEGVARPIWVPPQAFLDTHVAYLPSGLVVRRECMERVGPFDQARAPNEDTDWFIRAAQAGFRAAEVREVLLTRRVHRSNATHGRPDSQRAMFPLIAAALARRRASGGAP